MSALQSVEKIVKNYFDNALIIDDELDFNYKEGEEVGPVSNGEIREVDSVVGDFVLMGSDDSRNRGEATVLSSSTFDNTQPTEHSQRPFETFQTFIQEGFITLPWKYKHTDTASELSNILRNAKLLVIDWNLEDSRIADQIGQSTLSIIKEFIEVNKGLKCVVIYTKEDFEDVKSKLTEYNYEDLAVNGDAQGGNSEVVFFQERESFSSSLFGFVMSKNISPQEIIRNISYVLFHKNNTAIHFIESASLIDRNIGEALTNFNGPFEKVFLTQIVTSQMNNTEIKKFFNQTLISNLLNEYHSTTDDNFLIGSKKLSLINTLNKYTIDESKVNGFGEILDITSEIRTEIKKCFTKKEFTDRLLEKLSDSNTTSFPELKKALIQLCQDYIKPKCQGDGKEAYNFNEQVFLFLTLIDEFLNSSRDEFKENYKRQIQYFTALMKYVAIEQDIIHTGTILKRVEQVTSGPSEDQDFLLCVTPFCDVFRLEEVDNKHKFLVGKVVTNFKPSNLKNDKANCHYLAIPNKDENGVFIVKFNFYDTVSIEVESLKSTVVYSNIASLKKEYIQKIINRYIAYQSRAGVDEIFYKESVYIKNFISFIKSDD